MSVIGLLAKYSKWRHAWGALCILSPNPSPTFLKCYSIVVLDFVCLENHAQSFLWRHGLWQTLILITVRNSVPKHLFQVLLKVQIGSGIVCVHVKQSLPLGYLKGPNCSLRYPAVIGVQPYGGSSGLNIGWTKFRCVWWQSNLLALMIRSVQHHVDMLVLPSPAISNAKSLCNPHGRADSFISSQAYISPLDLPVI